MLSDDEPSEFESSDLEPRKRRRGPLESDGEAVELDSDGEAVTVIKVC